MPEFETCSCKYIFRCKHMLCIDNILLELKKWKSAFAVRKSAFAVRKSALQWENQLCSEKISFAVRKSALQRQNCLSPTVPANLPHVLQCAAKMGASLLLLRWFCHYKTYHFCSCQLFLQSAQLQLQTGTFQSCLTSFYNTVYVCVCVCDVNKAKALAFFENNHQAP